ncbi:MAG: hypothetical protein R2694_07110 [Ilumatobacteraceae bacterium]
MLALPVLALLLAACGSDEPSVVTASAPTTPAPTVSTSADPAPSSTTASSPGGDRILDAVEALSAFGAAQQGTVTAEGCILFPAEAVWPASLAADFPFSRAKSTSVGFDAARHQVNLSCRFSSDPQDDYVYVSLGAAGEYAW